MTLDLPELTAPPRPSDLTIALCTIGRDGYLQEAIRSLLATTPSGVSLHVVFNAPDDEALVEDVRELVSIWDGPAEITELGVRLDIAASHNTALDACQNDFITFMGDDDLVLEPRVERLLGRFWSIDPTPAVIGSYCRRVSGPPDDSRFSTNKDYGPSTVAAWATARDDGELIEVVFPSAIYRTAALRAIGGFEERFSSAMDIASFTRIAQFAPVLADRRRSFAHRIHDASVTSSRAVEHAIRLRYVAECAAAWHSANPEPTWDEFRTGDSSRSRWQRLGEQRRTKSAAMFREGGAALATGGRLRGAAKSLSAAVLSPSTFLRRARAQVTRPDDGEPVVTILVKNCNHYRVPFYNELRRVLATHEIELRLVVGDGLPEDTSKGDRASMHWAEHRPIRHIRVRGRDLVWQPGFDVALGSDLVITEQASKQLFNAVLAFGGPALRTRVAFWGHGRNFQAALEGESGEGLKQALTARVDWFFAYNEISAEAVVETGFPADRVTTVMNATDTAGVRAVLERLPDDHDAATRRALGAGDGPVALYLGGIYEPKRPQFLIDAALALRQRIPDVELLVIGGGSREHLLEDAAEQYDWIHATGPIYGDERVRRASICSLQLMPGLVGLNIVDAFALGLPTVTTDVPYHSPEIDYLIDGVNGLIVTGDPSPEAYADAVAALLQDEARLHRLQQAAAKAGRELTIERMAANFAEGVREALAVDA